MTQYATAEDLEEYLGGPYVPPDEEDVDRVLTRASEIVSYYTAGLAKHYWRDITEESPHDVFTAALRDATMAQVEYWLEVGEEHDVVGLKGMIQAGRVQVSKLPGDLGPRARRTLVSAGLFSARAGIR